MMWQTIVVLQYCRRSINFLNYWFTDTCTRTWKVSWRIVITALLRAGRLFWIYSNTLLLIWSHLKMSDRWIQFTRTFLRPLIRCVIVGSWIKCRLILSHFTVSGWVLTFLVESSAVFLGIFWSVREFHRAAIWGHSVSFGLWMRSLGFLGTCGCFFMLTTWNCFLHCVVSVFYRAYWWKGFGNAGVCKEVKT
jgi:hypothetical protein